MNGMDFDQEQRRAQRYQDISRSAFAIGLIALCLVTAFAFLMLLPDGWRHG